MRWRLLPVWRIWLAAMLAAGGIVLMLCQAGASWPVMRLSYALHSMSSFDAMPWNTMSRDTFALAVTPETLRKRFLWVTPIVLAVALSACGSDGDAPSAATPDAPSESLPSVDPAPQPERNAAYLSAKPGDVLKVRIEELRPTQMAIGYDQIYYKLGRWQGDFDRPASFWSNGEEGRLNYLSRTVQKKFEDYCEDTGQGKLNKATLDTVEKLQAARLDMPETFACMETPGSQVSSLKTVVIGWDGNLYLTDGHHTFSSLRTIPDGGPQLPVWVRVDANFSDIGLRETFWQRMVDERKAWLRDADNQPVTADQLPSRVGPASEQEPGGMQDDPYRALVYFTRDIGYSNGGLPEFAEFMWADWLRRQITLTDYKTAQPAAVTDILAASGIRKNLGTEGSDDSYVAAVRDAAQRMSQQADDAPVFQERLAKDLGRIAWEAGAADDSPTDVARSELKDLPRNDVKSDGTPRGAGKLWFAVNYRLCGKPVAGTACWGY